MRLFRWGHICQIATQTWICASFSSYCSSMTWQNMSWTIWKNAFKITMENSKCVKCIFFQPSWTTNFTSTECPGFSINHKYFYNAKTSVLTLGKLLCAISTLFCTQHTSSQLLDQIGIEQAYTALSSDKMNIDFIVCFLNFSQHQATGNESRGERKT